MDILSWNAGRVKHILIIKMRYIGDTVLVTPLLGALKHALPKTRLSFLVNRQSAGIVGNHPHIDNLIVFDYDRAKRDIRYVIKFLLKLRRAGFDMIIDLTRNDRSALFTFISGAPIRMGYEGSSYLWNKAYTHRRPYTFGKIHTVDHHLLMADALGLSAVDFNPYLVVSEQDIQRIRELFETHKIKVEKPTVIIHPGARRWYKSWPMERFSSIADMLMNHYPVQVVLSGGPEDRKNCDAILKGMQNRGVNLCENVPLEQLPALIHESVLLIGNDSAPIHIATAVNTPVIALFGPTRWEAWQPRRNHDKTLGISFPCRPCGHSRPDCPMGDRYCMSQITEKMVWNAIEDSFHEMGIKGLEKTISV